MPRTALSVARSLLARLIIAFVVAIVATTVAAGAPAYWFIRTELERQAWARVADGERITKTLLETEKAHLSALALHTAQRPTLQKLVQAGNQGALRDYVQAFRAEIGLDLLVVSDTSGRLLTDQAMALPALEAPYPSEADFYVLPGSEPKLALLVSRPIPDDRPKVSYVTLGNYLDDDFVHQLAHQTGFGQSILIAGKQAATSLAGGSLPVDQAVVEQVIATGQTEMIPLTLHQADYYVALVPLRDAKDTIVALAEIDLPVDELVTASHRALIILVFSTFLVAVGGSVLAAIQTQRLTRPLAQLIEAAKNISRGNLTTPTPIPKAPSEIAALAAAFEESRINMHRFLENLTQAKAWSETLLQSIVEGIVTMDEQGCITSFSEGAERIMGWKSEEVLNKPINQVLPLPDGDGQFTEHIPPPGGMTQISVLTRNGREVALAVTGTRLRLPDDATPQLALVLRDTTEEEAARRLRSYFLANISHEFRTPLSALNASIQLLLEEIESLSQAQIVELLNAVHLSVSGLQNLIDNLLESASIEAGRFRIRRRPAELDEVVAEALRVMKPLLERRQQSLSLDKPAHWPTANVDPTRLTQVLVNLLSNASKYSPVEETIELSLRVVDDKALYGSVADRGPGIPPAERAHLFRQFVRLRDQEGTQYGIGLGLSVVKAIVEGHGGQVGVDDRPGGGAIFWFKIPLNGQGV